MLCSVRTRAGDPGDADQVIGRSLSVDRSIDSAADSRSSSAQSVAMRDRCTRPSRRGVRRFGRRAGSAVHGSTAVPSRGSRRTRQPTGAPRLGGGAVSDAGHHRVRRGRRDLVGDDRDRATSAFDELHRGAPEAVRRRPELRPTARSWASRSTTARSSSSAQSPALTTERTIVRPVVAVATQASRSRWASDSDAGVSSLARTYTACTTSLGPAV